MRRVKEEAEVIVRLDYLDKKAHILMAAWPAMARRMRKLYGDSLDGNSDSSQRWIVPIRQISFRKLAGLAPRKGGFANFPPDKVGKIHSESSR